MKVSKHYVRVGPIIPDGPYPNSLPVLIELAPEAGIDRAALPDRINVDLGEGRTLRLGNLSGWEFSPVRVLAGEMVLDQH